MTLNPTPPTPRTSLKPLWITLGVIGGVLLLGVIAIAVVVFVVLTPKVVEPTIVQPTNQSEPSGMIQIAGTPVTLVDGVVEAECFSFTLPEGYMVSPTSTDCSTEIRVDPGDGSSGDTLGSYRIAAQINVTSDTFIEWVTGVLNGNPITDTKTITVDGAEATVVYYDGGFGLSQSITYVPLGDTAFVATDDPIGGYLILAPGADIPPTQTILGSFNRK